MTLRHGLIIGAPYTNTHDSPALGVEEGQGEAFHLLASRPDLSIERNREFITNRCRLPAQALATAIEIRRSKPEGCASPKVNSVER